MRRWNPTIIICILLQCSCGSAFPSQQAPGRIHYVDRATILFESQDASDSGRRRKFPSAAGFATIAGIATTLPLVSDAVDMGVNGKGKQRVGGLANKIRGITKNMDELQRDLMQERW